MKTYDETINSVMKKSDAYTQKRLQRNKTVKKMSVGFACVFAAVLTAAVLLNHFDIGLNPVTKGESDFAFPHLSEENSTEIAFETVGNEPDRGNSGEQTTAPPMGHTTVSDWNMWDDVEYPEYSSAATQGTIDEETTTPPEPYSWEGWDYIAKKVTGEFLTDEEAAKYFAENKQSLISSLSASGVGTDNIKIMKKGYCHMNISDAGGLETKVNYRDYLVYNGSSLVAIVTLCKEDGKIYSTPSFGAQWFSIYNDFLEFYKGQELVFVYCGGLEYFITPDNQVISPMGIEIIPEFFTSDFNYHGALNDGINAYVP